MATLTSEKLSLEIRIRDIDPGFRIHYDAWFRYSGKPVVNPDILNRGTPYWQDRIEDGFRGWDDGEAGLIPTIRMALEQNQPVHWSPLASGFDLFIYPQIYFPPTRKEDFDFPFDFSYILPDIGKERRAYREISGGLLPDDFIWIYARANLSNFGEEKYYCGSGLALEMIVQRWELEVFLFDLETEYARLRRGEGSVSPFSFLGGAQESDLQPRPIRIALFQGDLQGSIRLSLVAGGQVCHIWASNITASFDSLVSFLIRLAEGNIPASCWIDEEGQEKIIRAEPLGEADLLRFQILEPDSSCLRVILSQTCSRRQLVEEAYASFFKFIEDEFDPDLWGRHCVVGPRLWEKFSGIVQGWKQAELGIGD